MEPVGVELGVVWMSGTYSREGETCFSVQC